MSKLNPDRRKMAQAASLALFEDQLEFIGIRREELGFGSTSQYIRNLVDEDIKRVNDAGSCMGFDCHCSDKAIPVQKRR